MTVVPRGSQKRKEEMIKIVAKMKVRADKQEEFLSTATELITKSRAEEGNISYGLHRSLSNPETLSFIENWKDQAAIDIHNETEHFTTICPKLADMCEGDMDVELFEEFEV